ncbi:MAG: sulfotransferase domain-containing protein [Candidatus Brocadiia bacterium]
MRLIIASYPRCGSTMLFRAITGFPPGSTTPKNHPDVAWVFLPETYGLSRDDPSLKRLPEWVSICSSQNLPQVPFLKTHSPAPEKLPKDVKCIYIFGNPIDAVWSTYRKRFRPPDLRCVGHFENSPPKILDCDALGFENVFDSWTQKHSYPVLVVRYEKLWQYKQILEEYLGRRFVLPEKRKRTTRVPEQIQQRLKKCYSTLLSKVRSYPDINLIASSHSRTVTEPYCARSLYRIWPRSNTSSSFRLSLRRKFAHVAASFGMDFLYRLPWKISGLRKFVRGTVKRVLPAPAIKLLRGLRARYG